MEKFPLGLLWVVLFVSEKKMLLFGVWACFFCGPPSFLWVLSLPRRSSGVSLGLECFMDSFDRFFFDADSVINAELYVAARDADCRNLCASLNWAVRGNELVAALMDFGPGRRATIVVRPGRVELVLDERYGSLPSEYTTEIYDAKDLRQVLAFWLATRW